MAAVRIAATTGSMILAQDSPTFLRLPIDIGKARAENRLDGMTTTGKEAVMEGSVYVLEGVTSDGDTFDFPGVRFGSLAEATAYANTYANSVSGTDEVFADYGEGWVRAVGAAYSETIRVREIVR